MFGWRNPKKKRGHPWEQQPKAPSSRQHSTTRKPHQPVLPPQQQERAPPPPPQFQYGNNYNNDNDDNHTLGDQSVYTSPSLATIQYNLRDPRRHLHPLGHRSLIKDDPSGGSQDSEFTSEIQAKLGAWQTYRQSQLEAPSSTLKSGHQHNRHNHQMKTTLNMPSHVAAAGCERRNHHHQQTKGPKPTTTPRDEFSLSTSLQFGNVPGPVSRSPSPTHDASPPRPRLPLQAVHVVKSASHALSSSSSSSPSSLLSHSTAVRSVRHRMEGSHPIDVDVLDDQQEYRGTLWSPDPKAPGGAGRHGRKSNNKNITMNVDDESFSDVLSRMEQESLAGRLAVSSHRQRQALGGATDNGSHTGWVANSAVAEEPVSFGRTMDESSIVSRRQEEASVSMIGSVYASVAPPVSFTGFLSNFEEQSLVARLEKDDESRLPTTNNPLIGRMIHTRTHSDVSVGTFGIEGVESFGMVSSHDSRTGTESVASMAASRQSASLAAQQSAFGTSSVHSSTTTPHDDVSFAGLFSQMEDASLAGKLNEATGGYLIDDTIQMTGSDVSIGTFLEDGYPKAYPTRNCSTTSEDQSNASSSLFGLEYAQEYPRKSILSEASVGSQSHSSRAGDGIEDVHSTCPSDVSLGSSIKPPPMPKASKSVQPTNGNMPRQVVSLETKDKLDDGMSSAAASVGTNSENFAFDDLLAKFQARDLVQLEPPEPRRLLRGAPLGKMMDEHEDGVERGSPSSSLTNDGCDNKSPKKKRRKSKKPDSKRKKASNVSVCVLEKEKSAPKDSSKTKHKKSKTRKEDKGSGSESSCAQLRATEEGSKLKVILQDDLETPRAGNLQPVDATVNTRLFSSSQSKDIDTDPISSKKPALPSDQNAQRPTNAFGLNSKDHMVADEQATQSYGGGDLAVGVSSLALGKSNQDEVVVVHVNSDSEDHVRYSTCSTISQAAKPFRAPSGPIDLDEVSVGESSSDGSSSHAEVRKEVGSTEAGRTHDPSRSVESPLDYDDEDDENKTLPKTKTKTSTSSTSSSTPRRRHVWTDNEDEDDGFGHAPRNLRDKSWSRDDDALLDLSYHEAMDSISVSTGRNQEKRPSLPLTEEELARHVKSSQVSGHLPATSLQDFDNWKKRKELQQLYFAKLHQKALRQKSESDIAKPRAEDRRTPETSFRPQSANNVRQKSHNNQSSCRRVASSASLQLMELSMDSTIQTIEGPPPKPRQSRSKPTSKPKEKRRWGLLGGVLPRTINTPGKENKKTQKKQRDVSVGLETFMQISQDEPEDVADVSLAPLRNFDPRILSSTLPAAQAATRARPLEIRYARDDPRQLALQHLELERQKQRQAEQDQVQAEMLEQERISRLKVRELERQRRLNQLTQPRVSETRSQAIFTSKKNGGSHQSITISTTKDTDSLESHGQDPFLNRNLSFETNESGVVSTPNQSVTLLSPCIICDAAERTHTAIPCMHYYFCQDCANSIKDEVCPICGQAEVVFSRIYT